MKAIQNLLATIFGVIFAPMEKSWFPATFILAIYAGILGYMQMPFDSMVVKIFIFFAVIVFYIEASKARKLALRGNSHTIDNFISVLVLVTLIGGVIAGFVASYGSIPYGDIIYKVFNTFYMYLAIIVALLDVVFGSEVTLSIARRDFGYREGDTGIIE